MISTKIEKMVCYEMHGNYIQRSFSSEEIKTMLYNKSKVFSMGKLKINIKTHPDKFIN